MPGPVIPDDRQPVIVGVGQLNQRVDQGAPPLEPADLMVEALQRAAADAGDGRLIDQADSMRVIHVFTWHYKDPGRIVADRLGRTDLATVYTSIGGNVPQLVLNGAARDIANGEEDIVLISGAEAVRTRSAHRKAGTVPDWTVQPESIQPDRWANEPTPLIQAAESGKGVGMPVQIYPLFESAWRAANGWTIEENRQRIATLWARFSEIAAKNPHAWIQRSSTPDELNAPDNGNRMIGFPYRKLMNSDSSVEQSAAIIMCSVAKARSLGIPTDRWVFPVAGTDASDSQYVSNRATMSGSPAIHVAGRRAMELAGIEPAQLDFVDLYSCFPSAVQISAHELGLDPGRDLTVTGGLSFAGGPWSNYVTHSVATMTELLRDAGGTGLISANGGYLTKHAFGVYSTTPPTEPFRWEKPQAEVDTFGSVELCESFAGPVTVESCTVMHDRDGSRQRAITTVRLPDGRRAWGFSIDDDVMAAMETEEFVGRAGTLADDDTLTV